MTATRPRPDEGPLIRWGERVAVRRRDAHPGRHARDRRLALLVTAGFAGVVGFQLSLVAGAPWGVAAYGGADPGRLPPELRVASAVQACVWLLAGLTALSRGGVAPSPIPDTLSRRAVWTFAGLLAVGTVVNAASSSRWERFGWAPFLLVLTVLTFELARSGRPRAR